MDLIEIIAKTLPPQSITGFAEDTEFMLDSSPKRTTLFISHALDSYLLRHDEIAFQCLKRALSCGFPPTVRMDDTSPWAVSLKKAQQSRWAVDQVVAAYLVNDWDTYHRMLSWTVETFNDADVAFAKTDGGLPTCAIYRALVNLAHGGTSTLVRRDLGHAVQHELRHVDPHIRQLHIVLNVLTCVLSGEVERNETAKLLDEFVRRTPDYYKQEAAFYALFLQKRFPEAFDEVLPPLSVPQ